MLPGPNSSVLEESHEEASSDVRSGSDRCRRDPAGAERVCTSARAPAPAPASAFAACCDSASCSAVALASAQRGSQRPKLRGHESCARRGESYARSAGPGCQGVATSAGVDGIRGGSGAHAIGARRTARGPSPWSVGSTRGGVLTPILGALPIASAFALIGGGARLITRALTSI